MNRVMHLPAELRTAMFSKALESAGTHNAYHEIVHLIETETETGLITFYSG